jgi:hypothetical protein
VAIDRTLASSTVKLGEQWEDILGELGRGWERAAVELRVADPDEVERVALLLGQVPDGETFVLDIERDAETVGLNPELVTRAVARLDAEGISAELELRDVHTEHHALAGEWRALVDALPSDWSHLLAQIDLDSSDFVDRGALLLGPTNPLLVDGVRALRFRCARRVGYGVSVGMAARCLERLDGEKITGRIALVHVVSDAQPVATQGPVWRLGGRPA